MPFASAFPWSGLVLALVMLCGVPAWAGPQDAASEAVQPSVDSQVFSEVVDVRIVNVDVFVSDKEGPVPGLSASDFILRVDGKETPVSNFLAVGEQPRTAATSSTDPLEPMEEEPLLLAPLEGAEPVSVALYLDNVSLEPADRARILDDLEKFAATEVSSEVRFLLATHEAGLRIRVPFTESVEAIREGLALAAKTPSWGMQSRIALQSAMRGVQDVYRTYEDSPACESACACGMHQMLAIQRQYSLQVVDRQQRVQDGLREMVGLLGAVSGRKAMIYVGSGLEQYPGLDLLEYLGDLCPDSSRGVDWARWENDESESLSRIAASANANQVTLYALHAGGMGGSMMGGVEAAEARFRPSLRVDATRRRNLEDSLHLLAEGTGGRAILNANAPLEPLRKLTRDFEHYYSLAFQLSGPPDGRVHPIEVRLANQRRGVEVRHRRSYLDKPSSDRHIERTLSALYLRAADNPIGLRIDVGEATSDGRSEARVRVALVVPEWALSRVQPEAAAHLHLTLATLDLDDADSDLRQMRIAVPAQPGVQEHPIGVAVRLAPGRYRLAVGVRDEASGASAYAYTEASIP